MFELPNTDWSMVHLAAEYDGNDAERREAMERLLRRYWPAIFAYIRRTGRDVHDASDLTQHFISTVLLQRDLPKAADPARGRFRTLLLVALSNFLRERHRTESRQSRMPETGAPSSLHDQHAGDARLPDRAGQSSPEAAFTYQYSATLVRQVLERVQMRCQAEGLEPHWIAFESRVVKPMLYGDTPVSLTELAGRLELESEAQVSNMIVTVKRRVARAIYEEIENTVADPSDMDDEVRHLMRDLERPA